MWIYGFFVMVLLALDFLYYSAINYELCRIYLEKWGLGGRWLKKARSQWHRSMPEESEAQAQAQPMVPTHFQPRHSLRGESHSPTLLPYNTSTAWWVTARHMTAVNLDIIDIDRCISATTKIICLWSKEKNKKDLQVVKNSIFISQKFRNSDTLIWRHTVRSVT